MKAIFIILALVGIALAETRPITISNSGNRTIARSCLIEGDNQEIWRISISNTLTIENMWLYVIADAVSGTTAGLQMTLQPFPNSIVSVPFYDNGNDSLDITDTLSYSLNSTTVGSAAIQLQLMESDGDTTSNLNWADELVYRVYDFEPPSSSVWEIGISLAAGDSANVALLIHYQTR